MAKIVKFEINYDPKTQWWVMSPIETFDTFRNKKEAIKANHGLKTRELVLSETRKVIYAVD